MVTRDGKAERPGRDGVGLALYLSRVRSSELLGVNPGPFHVDFYWCPVKEP